MLGLIEKDLRLTLKRKQTLMVFFVMALIMGLSMDGSFIIGYLTLFASIVAIGTISYDEFDNGFSFLMTLPFGRKTYVREKYLFSLMLAAIAWCFGIILCCVENAIRQNGAIRADELPKLFAFIPLMYLSAAIMIPLQLKFGSEKSRIVLFIIFGFLAALLFGGARTSVGTKILGRLVEVLDQMSSAVVLAVIVAVCMLLAGGSYYCSIKIMEKKEF
ncbi:MAG: ABC-2 transporter permease [Lachnospiraceae bacterium]|nr:ABC-2 transporter permease [Lachnospiraceae bacterium]